MAQKQKLDVNQVVYHGTVLPAKDFNPTRDAETLRKAMKGFGTEELHIIAVLEARTNAQRQQIAKNFKEQFSKDLIEELKSELSGKFEAAIIALMQPAAVYDACALQSAMQGLGTKESVLTEILCSRTAEEIEAIKKTYQEAYGKELIKAVKSDTSGDFRTFLVALLSARRVQTKCADVEAAYGDATKLYEAGEKKWGTDESMFINILTTRSRVQLRVAKCDIVSSIHSELSGDFRDGMDALVRCVRDPPMFFADTLHAAMSWTQTDSAAVTRVIISRSEIDLVEIMAAYKSKYGKSLNSVVVDRMRGTHEALLLKILGE